MKTKNTLVKFMFLIGLMIFAGCEDDDAAVPITEEVTTLEIIQDSPNHTILEQLLEDTGLSQTLNQGAYTIFAPTDEAFGNISTSGLTTDQLRNILLNHVLEGAAQSENLSTSYVTTLATEQLSGNENQLSLYVNVGNQITLNGISTVTGPNNLATNGVVHVVDEVITIPNVTTFATADSTFEVLVQALTRDDQPDFVGTLSSFDTPAPFTVFAPTNDAFTALLNELELGSLADISGEVLTSTLNTHVIANANITSSNLPSGTVETLGASFELNGTTITDQNNRTIEIVVTDVQAGNGVVHVVNTVILPDLGTEPAPNIVQMTVDNDGAQAYFVSSITGNETPTSLNTNNSAWTLNVGTRYELTVVNAGAHPFQIRNASDERLLSQNSTGTFESDPDVNFVDNGQQFYFTLTADLAAEISTYYCGIHTNSMNGSISVN
ncbi:fasciclin domain-containing protein [Psychroflexus sp. YR1-1]|uniref:Fasciclin domain-containing protein n=1 Tax=Psychroflexus aurantiacus TaxID=2709310 RepID=A0A6B3R7S1_9FLAO|nr:fasciclin domain-containing protein [Psychroflexus aurantiacus]NEV93791.1 fasciclin domain-containing protein [Psychroflexus aurantiacus]